MKEFKYHEQWKNPKTNRMNGHVYTLDNVPLYGITSILNVISKPNLYQWYADMVAIFIKDNCKKDEFGAFMVMPEQLEKARVSANNKKTDSADIGTIAHKMVEMFVNGKIAGKTLTISVLDGVQACEEEDDKKITITPKDFAMIKVMYDNFIQWVVENESNGLKFLFSEKKIFSEKYWIAGTLDLIFELNGKVYIGDVKTYSGIYDRTPFFQCGGYDIMVEENKVVDKIDGYYIIRLGKDGTFDTHESYDRDGDRKGFISALELFKQMQTFVKPKWTPKKKK